MLYLSLFLTFFEIGAVSFGGGYAMISLIRERTISQGWLTEDQLLNMIAVAESTPGPIAVNMATFVGSTQGGVLGSLVATLGVVLPSFLIILLITAIMRNLLKRKGVQAFLSGVRPCAIGLILGTAVTLLLTTLLDFQKIGAPIHVDFKGIIILALLVLIRILYRKRTKKVPSPILMILLSAGMGLLLYGLN